LLLVGLLQELVGDWLLLPELVGNGLTRVTVVLVWYLLVLVGKGLPLVLVLLQLLVMAGG
jgi:hypothetical protein